MLLKGLHILLLSLFTISPLVSQRASLQESGDLANGIDESSGLAFLPSGKFVQINDGGNPPCIFFVDSTGALLELDCPDFLINKDWEDLAYGGGHLYVGDFGNNNNIRHLLAIHKVEITDKLDLKNNGSINFSYVEQTGYPPAENDMNYDVEAMFYNRDSLFLFTKNHTKPNSGYTYLYALPTEPGNYEIARRDSFKLGNSGKFSNWVTGADINPSRNIMALLGYNRLWLFYDFSNAHYFSGRMSTIKFHGLSQKESICFSADSTLFISDESNPLLKGGKMYRLKLSSDHFTSTSDIEVKLLSNEVFDDEIRAEISGDAPLPILWEMFTVNGDRPLFGKIDSAAISGNTYLLNINTSSLPAGGYVLSIIVADRPHAYKLKKLIK